jgi:RHS repeat-associated protein
MNQFKRIFAAVMSAICLFAFSLFEPLYAISDMVTTDRQTSEAITELNDVWDEGDEGRYLAYSPIIGELTELRQESEKHLRREDGASELIVYPYAVHYEKDEKWEAIDNTLEKEQTADGNTVYKNKASDFIVSFSAFENAVTVEYNGEKLSFHPIEERGNKVYASVVDKETVRGDLTAEEQDQLWRFPDELSSSIIYISEDTRSGEISSDIEYRLSSKSLSEFITLKEKPDTAPVYSYAVKSSLIPKQEGNTVRFENADGETILLFSAPYMSDAKGVECYDFKVTIEKDGDGYIYTMIPDAEWLNAKDRAYPVVIDPDINVNFRNHVEDTFISSGNPTTCYGSSSSPANATLQIGGSTGYRTMIRLKEQGMPQLKAGDVIVQADLVLTAYDAMSAACTEIDAHALLSGNWYAASTTWNTYAALNGGNPANYNKVESLALVPATDCPTTFNITPVMKKWIAGEMTNGGLILVSPNNNLSKFRSSRSSNSFYYQPYYRVVYVNSTGLEGRFSYSSQSAGRAGDGSVNLYSGNLTFTVSDAGINNGTMPISVSHVYNTNDKDTDIGYGYGWRLNYAQYIEAVSIENGSAFETYYKYIDGDGTAHYYKKKPGSSTEYINELDTDSKLVISNGTLRIIDKADNKLVFTCGWYTLNNTKVYLGHLTSIEDANGNKILITYDPASFNGSVYKNMRITSITEKLAGNSSNGQSITLSYNTDGRLSSMTAPNGLNQTFGYSSSGDLISIGYTDGKSATYTYSAHKITQAKNIDNYSINYEYNADNRVTKALEKQGTANGNYLTYDYGWNVTTVVDNLNRDTIYQFNNAGQAVSIRNAEGQAVFAAYKKEDRATTKLSAVSKMQYTTVNLLKNHGFEAASLYQNWTVQGTGSTTVDTYSHAGTQSVRLGSSGVAYQAVNVTSGEKYTFSAYFKGANTGKLSVYNGSTLLAQSDLVGTNGTSGNDWARAAVTFTAPSSSVTVKIENTGSAYIYADSAQLEVGETPNRYNMLINSDFTNGTAQYSTSGLNTSVDKVVTVNDDSHPSYLSNNALKLTGSATTFKRVYQDIPVANGQAGDTYSFGGWCRSNSVPLSTQIYNYSTLASRQYGFLCLKVQFITGNGASTEIIHNESIAYFAVDTEDWQYACSNAVADSAYTKIRLTICFDYTRNEAYFDGLQLHREQFSQSYTYDANGNLTGYLSLIGQEPTLAYDDNNNVTSSTDPLGHTTNYTYDSKHNLLTSTTPLGTVTTNTYDTNGNVTQTKVGNSTNYISSSTTYDSASALATAVTDARGNSVTYGYNSATRQQTSITDAKGNTSTYNYGDAASMLRLASLSSAGTGTVNYTYDQYGNLTRIARGTTYYNFTYDSWGRQLATKVGNTALSTNTYDQYGRLSSITYGNGFKTEYEYDNLDRTSKIYERANASATQQLAYEFIYDGEDELYELRNYKTNRATFFEYDHAGRCMASTEKNFTVTNGIISYAASPVAGYKYDYDLNNNLTKLVCKIGDSTWTTIYTYDKDNRPTVTTLHNGKTITDTYDIIGRITRRRLGIPTNYDTDITYIAGANGSKTALVSTYKNGGDAKYNYTYDANGNITQIWRGNGTFASATEKYSYSYDAANQLIRENLYYGAGNSNNATYTYTYDSWGNILTKKQHAYSTGSAGHGIVVANYGYTNSTWKDQLTSYNNQSITYDAMGNPISYLGATLSWNGKQLTGYSKTGTNVTYAYNEDGLRTQKTYNGTTTNYYYNGSVLIGMQSGNTVQRFSYDAQGKVVAVDYSENGGSSYTTYYYLRNAQGDIVKLIDGNRNTVVEYTYDSWGKILATTGSLATTLGANQPFRYRGYVYDTETQCYYLQSRYYNPETCRFISSDVLLSTGQGVIGHNAYAYCGNNPIANSDPLGTAWWHWAIAGALVVGAAVACVVTCGGAAPAIAAVACVANGVTAATTSATVAAGVFIGSSTALATSAAYTLSTSGSVEEFLDQGSWGTVANTLVGGAMGGVSAYSGAKSSSNGSCNNLDSKTKCFVAGTLIKTDYSAKAIEDIAAGDYVYATDPETGLSRYMSRLYKSMLHFEH